MKIIVFFHLPLYILRYCKVGDGLNRREQTVVLLELFLYTDWISIRIPAVIMTMKIMNEWMDIQEIFGVVTTQCVFVTGHKDFEENSAFLFRMEVGRVTIKM